LQVRPCVARPAYARHVLHRAPPNSSLPRSATRRAGSFPATASTRSNRSSIPRWSWSDRLSAPRAAIVEIQSPPMPRRDTTLAWRSPLQQL